MTIKFKCPVCGMALLADDDMAGRDIRCPSCRAVFPVPSDRPHSEPAPTSESPRNPDPPLFERGYDDSPDPDRQPERPTRPPRPRRRRPPPSSGGSTVLLWIAGIFGVLLVGSCACCGGGYFLLPGEQWRTYQSPSGGFSVEFPFSPENERILPEFEPGPDTKTEGGVLVKRAEEYVVMWLDLTQADRQANTDEEILNNVLRDLQAGTRTAPHVLSQKRITVSGFPAREVDVRTEEGRYFCRYVIAERRLYVAIAGGPLVQTSNTNIRRFLDSFTVTDPAPKGPPRWKRR